MTERLERDCTSTNGGESVDFIALLFFYCNVIAELSLNPLHFENTNFKIELSWSNHRF